MTSGPEPTYGQSTAWQPERPRLLLFPLLVSWFATGVALMVAAWILPGVDIATFWGALLLAAVVAALNAVIPPILAALRLPLPLVSGFLLVLIADALILLGVGDLDLTDPLVSPLFGSLAGLPPTAVYYGNLEIPAPDGLVLQDKALATPGADLTFILRKGELHGWPGLFWLPEAQAVLPDIYRQLGVGFEI